MAMEAVAKINKLARAAAVLGMVSVVLCCVHFVFYGADFTLGIIEAILDALTLIPVVGAVARVLGGLLIGAFSGVLGFFCTVSWFLALGFTIVSRMLYKEAKLQSLEDKRVVKRYNFARIFCNCYITVSGVFFVVNAFVKTIQMFVSLVSGITAFADSLTLLFEIFNVAGTTAFII